MIDENLPIFYYKASKENVKQDATIFVAQYGNEPTPAYTLRHPDPASADSRNRYAAALYDPYNPDVLFGEVLLIPEWAQAAPIAEELRKNGGVPPRPEPTLPHKTTIQLYNPDQQLVLTHLPSKWNASEAWDFDLPQQTFRQPSASALDRGQNDPAALEATPTIPLKWKRESKLSKDLTCFLSWGARNPDGSKKKHKEPDIPLAFFKNLREITLYEPNLSRIEIEDPKGFEVILLLSATIIRDVYHGTLQQTFNIADNPLRRGSAENKAAHSPPPAATLSKPPTNPTPFPHIMSPPLPAQGGFPPHPPQAGYSTHPPPGGFPTHPPQGNYPPQRAANAAAPPTDPRSQWEIDAETARLRKAAEAEAKQAAKDRRREDKRSEKAAQRFAEEEDRAARSRQAAIDAETERLRQAYATEQGRIHTSPPPPLPPRTPVQAAPADSRSERKRREKEAKEAKDRRNKGKHTQTASVPSAQFLQAPPEMGPGWMPDPNARPASSVGFAPSGYGGPGGSPGWTNPANAVQRPVLYDMGGGQGGGLRPVPPAPQSGGLLSSFFGGSSGGRTRSASDSGDRTLLQKKSSLF